MPAPNRFTDDRPSGLRGAPAVVLAATLLLSGFAVQASGADVPAGTSAPPRPVGAVQPEYPAAARDLGVDGRVLCSVTIDERGGVASVEVVESASPLLADAARDALLRWSFEPATRNGQAVSSTVIIPVQFKLR